MPPSPVKNAAKGATSIVLEAAAPLAVMLIAALVDLAVLVLEGRVDPAADRKVKGRVVAPPPPILAVALSRDAMRLLLAVRPQSPRPRSI